MRIYSRASRFYAFHLQIPEINSAITESHLILLPNLFNLIVQFARALKVEVR